MAQENIYMTCHIPCEHTHSYVYYTTYSYVYKRDLYHSKETCVTQNKPIPPERDLYHSKDICITQKRPVPLSRDLYWSQQAPVSHDTFPCGHDTILRVQKRPISLKRNLNHSKESCTTQHRPVPLSRGTCIT